MAVSQTLTGLETSTLYHYRITATNSGGTSYGEDKTFTTGYPSEWLYNGKEAEYRKTKAEGTLLVEDKGLAVTAECGVAEEGEVEEGKYGDISKVTGAKGESVVSCHVVKAGWCEGSTAEVEATGLPWNTELVDEPIKNEKGEVVRDEVRERFYKSAGPGWVLKCKSELGTKGIATDTCVGETSGNVENVSAGVPVEFDAKSPHLVCSGSGGKEKVGVVEGALVFASTTEGATLSVYGAKTGPLAPVAVTSVDTKVTSTGATLNGVVAPKGAETTYHFEYGTSTTYGKRVPLTEEVKVGAGRLPVAVSQTLTGLETSTLYHYRITATNSGGTSYGEDKTFTTGYPSEWLYNGKEAEYRKTKAEGTLLVEDKGLAVTAECGVAEEGEVEEGKYGDISKVTGAKGESVVSCHVVKAGWCEGSTAEVEATGLPWNTELVDEPIKNEKGEVVRDEVRERFYKSAGPGWVLKCKSELGTKGIATDTCVGETSGNVENVSAGVPVEFDAKSPHLVCSGSGGKEKVGVVEGALVFASTTEGATLSVYGAKTGPLAPVAVTSVDTKVTSTGATLNGVVAPKGAETTYHFEYGTSTTYGKRVPLTEEVKVGAGRLPVAVSQTLTGLETSTLYHYRITATNSGGTSYGEDKTFTTGYPSEWLYNGKEAEYRKTKAEGTLLVEDKGLAVTAECGVAEEGEVEEGKYGDISKVTGAKGESVVSCHVVKAGWCEGSTAEVEATGLPWNTELVDEPIKNEKGEVVRDEVRERFYKSAGPGWVLKCKSELGTKGIATDTCVGETSGNVENVSAGVPVEFDAKSPHLVCSGSGGKEKVGVVEGALVFASTTEGATLSVYGAKSGPLAPVAVTSVDTKVTSTGATLNGVVAPKGAETTYHFEYGTSTTYGKRVPLTEEVKVGAGRLPVAVSQTLTGLETSTLYHYRITATNSGGTSYGEDKTFTTGYPSEWLYNGKEAEYRKTKAEGTVVLEDGGMDVAVECPVSETGEVTEGRYDTISKVTNTKGESKFTCHVIKQGFCGEASVEAQATSLPWKTELIDEPIKNEKGEVVRYEPRERFYGSSMPGWQLSCKVFGSVASDTCTGEPSGNVENVTAGVPVEFDSKSPSLACTGSAIGTGTVEGVLLFTSTEGTLSVYGAKTGPLPPAVATGEPNGVTSSGASLNGTVAAKALETTYHFEYGTSTKYGSRVPLSEEAKAGSGRTRVPVSQSVTGLEASTVYHYRIVATNSAGTSYGEDETFTTAP